MIRKKCKYPECRKMVRNDPNTPEERKDTCCITHQPLIHTYQKPEECPVCCSPFQLNLPLFPCYHWVCKDCIIHTGKKECPVCRQDVFLSKEEDKKIEIVAKRIQKEKQQAQMDEDRRLARQLQDQESPRRNVIQIVVTQENMNEILEILGALSPGERRVYLHALGIEEE